MADARTKTCRFWTPFEFKLITRETNEMVWLAGSTVYSKRKGAKEKYMKVFSHVATKWPWFRSVMAELLSNETRAGTSGGAAAHRCGARGVVDWQVDGGVGQPIAGRTRARQAMVVEGGSRWNKYFKATLLVVGTDGDDSEISPENIEIEIRLYFERDLIEVKN